MIMRMFMSKFIYWFHLYLRHIILIAFAILLQYMFNFCQCNYREEFRKQEVTGKEQSKRSEIKPYFKNTGRIISAPAAGQVIAVNGSNNNYKTFEPHTNVNQY